MVRLLCVGTCKIQEQIKQKLKSESPPSKSLCSRTILSPLLLPCSSRSTGILSCSRALPGFTEPQQASSGMSAWVPCAAISTLGFSYQIELAPGKETWVPSVLRFHTPPRGFCHSPVPVLRSGWESRSLSEVQGVCSSLAYTCLEHFLSSGAWKLYTIFSQWLFYLCMYVSFHSMKGPEFWQLKPKKRLCNLFLDTSKMPYQKK